MTRAKVRTEDSATRFRKKIAKQNEDKRSLTGQRGVTWAHYSMVHTRKPRVPAQIIDRGAVMPAARLFAAGIISRAEMMARISVSTSRCIQDRR